MAKKVTFELPKHIVAEASEGVLLGDFNNWNTEAGIPLKKTKEGSLTTTIELEPGQAYQYRYLLNDGRWENDDTAQYYVSADGLFVENCVIVVPASEEIVEPKVTKAPAKKAPAKKTTVANKEAAATENDDLVKIEGIGKQIATLLNKNNITTYAALAKTTVKKLKEILETGGAKFNVHNPTSWPKQAKLAAIGKWEELATLQKELKGGK